MNSPVTLKTSKSEKHWIYVLEAYESGNSTEYVICFDDNETLRGVVIRGMWEFDAFFKLAEKVRSKLLSIAGHQKTVSVSLQGFAGLPMNFKAIQEGDADLWKVVFTCPSPAQEWLTWKSGSGSPRNFILYLTWSQMCSLFEKLSEIPEHDAEDCGHVESDQSWVTHSTLDGLSVLPKQILSSARLAFADPNEDLWSHFVKKTP